jgi:hypothetical protein
MGRDKRIYRFVQDTRFGRIVLAESHEATAIVSAVTDYVARRIIEREHALVTQIVPTPPATADAAVAPRAPRRRGGWMFVAGFLAGMLALLALALLAPQLGL